MYADIIVDISSENLDKTYQYRIPEELAGRAVVGAPVIIPFGRGTRTIRGYIVGLSEEPKLKPEKIKPITAVPEGGIVIESRLISLAYWIKQNYGASMNEALRTVIPVKKSVKQQVARRITAVCTREELTREYEEALRKKYAARARLLNALLLEGSLNYEETLRSLNLTAAALKPLIGRVIQIEGDTVFRNPIPEGVRETLANQGNCPRHVLNERQQRIADSIIKDYEAGIRKPCLIHGVTGSGKTEVYMEIIDAVVKAGYQVIMLIPEIALTYQTVCRFYARFGERVSVMNSRMSAGERFDQSVRAKEGLIDIMIGPRSALFTPFPKLGLIIMDEEHEGSYKSEMPPKYHARETAIERARQCGAMVVMGSATPSIEAYSRAVKGEYTLYRLPERAGAGTPPSVWVEDLREELKAKNRSIFSRRLRAMMEDRLQKKQQIMLFINRRGFAGFVSCRSCGHVMKCPHCDISLTSHNDGSLVCHYCGHRQSAPKLCPECGSPYIAGFGIGTQKVEAMVHKEFPGARVVRMDADTTRTKEGHEQILKAFAAGDADILIGTQMIVKGHDFHRVTLVGILAADLSLYASDYRASERTFELLLQAAGRAGRGSLAGDVVIQTYHPEHYSIQAAARGSYEEFYHREMAYRRMLGYPPASHIMVVLVGAKQEEKAEQTAAAVKEKAEEVLAGSAPAGREARVGESGTDALVSIIGPAPAALARANDVYRYVVYFRHRDYGKLTALKDSLEEWIENVNPISGGSIQFDFDPMVAY